MKSLFLLLLVSFALRAQQLPITFQEKTAENKIEVYAGGSLFTALLLDKDQSIKKPVLYPILSSENHFVTRGWPISPREGERKDHPHQLGLWLNMGDVNGNDFWNNSYERDHTKQHFGTIVFTGIKRLNKNGELAITADWLDHLGTKLLEEETTYRFSATSNIRTIDRETTLTATEKVNIKDNKEGLFALRLAKELEHPASDIKFTPTGEYTNDSGIKGADVWAKRSEWMRLTGQIENENVTVAIFDHPKNHNFPAHWHARGYGLFAVNNIGSSAFTDGKESSDLELSKGEKLTLKYRVVIASKHLSEREMKNLSADFQK
jgi:hypothetical protein